MSASPGLISGEFAGRYTVERELGRGATSVVYLARDRDYARMVAIKVLRQELSGSGAADRFLREVRLTAQLHHPNIVPVLHSGEHTGHLFFVLPYLDGGTLRDRLEREKQLPIADVVSMGKTIALALASAHEWNILHRDVKPENILFSAGQACLADFGIARAITRASGESVTSTGLVVGTPAYMSPEQASGDREYDGRSDLYSLACVLYESLAGIPAFVGATAQAILAQRMLHEPRPVRIYRPSVSVELEAVLARALSLSPADRFPTAEAFAEALGSVPVTPTSENARTAARPSARRRYAAATVGVAIVASALYAGARAKVLDRLWPGDALDTTRVAVLLFEGAVHGFGSRLSEPSGADLVFQGLQRWRGLNLVEDFAIADAIERRGPIHSVEQAQRVARDLSAGRFVRVSPPTGSAVDIGLYDTRTGAPIYGVRIGLPSDTARYADVYAAAADSIVLRGNRDDSTDGSVRFATVAGAQTFARGRAALRDWDLARAESLFATSVGYESSPRALLWLAQVRAWRARTYTPSAWRLASLAAAADTTKLISSERLAAVALRALADSNFSAACSAYDRIIKRDSVSFVGWYGLGQCHDFDLGVVRDPLSRTGWRFRSSYHQAIKAYVRAFELLPSSFNGFSDGSFTFIRQRLFTSTRYLRSGYDVAELGRSFYARPSLAADTIVFVPIPRGGAAVAGSGGDIEAAKRAVNRLRRMFHSLATGWVAALPHSLGAREALAVSLEVLGDPAAADSFESVMRQAADPRQRLRLAVASIVARVKTALPDDTLGLARARSMADSILTLMPEPSEGDAELVSRLAAVVGRCSRAAAAARASGRAIDGAVIVPRYISGEVQVWWTYYSLGCHAPSNQPSLESLRRALHAAQASDAMRRMADYFAFSAVVQAMSPADSQWILRVAAPGSRTMQAQLEWLRGHADAARAILDSASRQRAAGMPGDFTPDVALPEVRLRLAMGDSATARQQLDAVLGGARFFAPMTMSEGVGNLSTIAALIRASALRAQLAGSDGASRTRWSRPAAILWANADPELRQSTRNFVK